AGPGEAVRGALRQGVRRGSAGAGPRQGREGDRGRLRAGRREIRRREARQRDDRGPGEGGAVRDPPPERRQGGPRNRRGGPGRQPLRTERLSRQGGAARLLELRLTDLTGPVAPRAVAREEAEGQALRPGRRPRRRQHREAAESDDGEGEAPL